MPRVSVVIPSYNRAHYLPEAVGSVLAQTYRDFEVIIVDDGSTDDTKAVVGGFGDHRIRYMYQENRGAAAAWNTGMKAAGGEYVAMLGSDNVLLKDALEKTVAFLDQHAEAGYCEGQVYTMDERGRPLRLKRTRGPRTTFVRDGREEIAHLLLGEPAEAFLIRRSCLEEIGFINVRLRMSEDWDMWFRLAKKHAVGHIAEPIAKLRYHAHSLTAQSTVETIESAHTAVMESVFKDPELGPRYGHLRSKAYFNLYVLFASVAARRGRRWSALKYLWKASKTCPALLWKRKGLTLLAEAAKDFLPRRPRNMIVQALIALKLR